MASKKKQIKKLSEQVDFLETLVEVMKDYLNDEYHEGVASGRNSTFDNLDAAIELKRNENDDVAVAVLEWAKERL
jgi:hypothetical protein